jgi:hypothetical protein
MTSEQLISERKNRLVNYALLNKLCTILSNKEELYVNEETDSIDKHINELNEEFISVMIELIENDRTFAGYILTAIIDNNHLFKQLNNMI